MLWTVVCGDPTLPLTKGWRLCRRSWPRLSAKGVGVADGQGSGSREKYGCLSSALRRGSRQRVRRRCLAAASPCGPFGNVCREPTAEALSKPCRQPVILSAVTLPFFAESRFSPRQRGCQVPEERLSAKSPLPIIVVSCGLCREPLSAQSLPRGFCPLPSMPESGSARKNMELASNSMIFLDLESSELNTFGRKKLEQS